jgi:hypothetical protein
VATVALLAGAVTIYDGTVDRAVAATGNEAAAPSKHSERHPELSLRAHTVVKTVLTKDRVNPYPPPPANSGAGRRVVYCNSCQRVWLIEADGWVYVSYVVSGRRNYPRNGTYKVIRRINPGYSHTLRLPYFVGFTYGNTTDVGFHGIPLNPNGTPIEPNSQLGTPRSHGCVRESQFAAKVMWDWASMGTPVVVVA